MTRTWRRFWDVISWISEEELVEELIEVVVRTVGLE
jgi:hypothetical protein